MFMPTGYLRLDVLPKMNTSTTYKCNQEQCALNLSFSSKSILSKRKHERSLKILRRMEREEHIRELAASIKKMRRKEIPKQLREYEVRAARKNKRLIAFFDTHPDTVFGEIEEQALFGFDLSPTQRSAETAFDSIARLSSKISERIDQFASSMKEMSEGLMWRIPLFVLCYCVANHFGVGLGCLALLIPSIAGYFGSWWINNYGAKPEIEEQGGEDVAALLATLVLSCIVPDTKTPAALADVVLRRAGGFERSKEGFKSLFTILIEYVEKLINACLSIFKLDEIVLMDSTHKILKLWMTKVDEFEKKCATGVEKLDDIRDAVSLLTDGIGFKTVVKTTQTQILLMKYLERLGMLIQSRRGALNSAYSFRQEPLLGLLGGASAVGKTTLLKYMGVAALILSKEVDSKVALENLWQKGTSDFWNGYVGQKCLIVDDAFQVKKPDTMSDSEYMTMIRAVGSWAYPLNFADVESKGRFYFGSPLILGTTNVEDIRGQAANFVSCPEAVTRRISHGYWITVHPEYATEKGTLDYHKMKTEFLRRMDVKAKGQSVVDWFPWEAWQLHRHSYDGAVQYSPSPVSPGDVVKDIAQALLQRKADFQAEKVLSQRFFEALDDESVETQSGIHELYGIEREESSTPMFGPEIYPDGYESEEVEIPFVVLDLARDKTRLDDIRESFMALAKAITGIVRKWGSKLLSCGLLGATTLGKAAASVWNRFAAETKINRVFRGMVVLGVVGITSAILLVFRKLVIAGFNMIATFIELVLDAIGWRAEEQSNVKEQVKQDVRRPTFARNPEVQVGNDPNDIQQKYIYENVYYLSLDRTEGKVAVGAVQFIEGNLAVMPKHFKREIRECGHTGKLIFTSAQQDRFNFRMEVADFMKMHSVTYPDMDVEFVRFDLRSLKAHKSILSYMLTEDQMAKFIKASGQTVVLEVPMPLYRADGTIVVTSKAHQSQQCTFLPNIVVKGSSVHQIFEYGACTKKGDCGSPLMIAENRHYGGAAYLGFHIAGYADVLARKGYATCVTRDMAIQSQKALKCYKDDIKTSLAERGVKLAPPSAEEQSALVGEGKLVDGSFLLLGKLDKPLSMGTQSALRVSPMGEQAVFGPAPKLPAILRPVLRDGEVKVPMVEGMKAYQSPFEWRDVKMLRLITEKVTQPFRQATKFKAKIILTPEEAVVGIEGMKLKKIARDTSPGYPYRLTSTGGKTKWFGKEGDYTLEGADWEALKSDALLIIEKAKVGERSCVIFTDFLKDELRPIAKVEAVATRCISGAPLDYTIAVRMMFGCFLAAMFDSRIDNCMAPGVNPYTEWFRIANKLLAKGNRLFAGDFSRFDASEQPYIHMEILGFINRWYASSPSWKPEDDLVREILWLDLIHSRHLTGPSNMLEYVVQWNKSLPSGHPLTTPVNSLYSLITLAVCYVHLTGDVDNIHDNVYFCTFGDDNVVGPSESVIEVFHQVSVSAKMQELFGLKYTSDKKGQDLVPTESLEEITFLKRSFKRDAMASGGISCPLDKESFMYVPYWYRSKTSCANDMLTNIKNLLGELSQHDESDWDECTSTLFPWMASYDMFDELPFTTRDGAREWISDNADIWF